MTKSTNPDAQRSNVKNPNNPSYVADRGNRIHQGHANVPPPPAEQGAPDAGQTGPKK